MKNYSCRWTISHDVILHMFYSQGQIDKLSILKFLILEVAFEMCRIVKSSQLIYKLSVAR